MLPTYLYRTIMNLFYISRYLATYILLRLGSQNALNQAFSVRQFVSLYIPGIHRFSNVSSYLGNFFHLLLCYPIKKEIKIIKSAFVVVITQVLLCSYFLEFKIFRFFSIMTNLIQERIYSTVYWKCLQLCAPISQINFSYKADGFRI